MSLKRSLKRYDGGWKLVKKHCFWCGELVAEGLAFKHLRVCKMNLKGESVYLPSQEESDDDEGSGRFGVRDGLL